MEGIRGEIRHQLTRGVKLLAETADRIHAPEPGVVALIYHRVGGRSGSEIDLPASLFDEQMGLLASRPRAVSIDVGLDAMAMTEPPPDGSCPVVVTFDDGTADFSDVALPILERHRVPAILYVATDFIERSRPFPADGFPLSWQALRDACSTGLVTVGSHTHTHALLDRLKPSEAAQELDASLALIEDRLGIRAEHFAYPKAVSGPPEVEAVVRRTFRSAAIGGGRPNPYGRSDPHRITRSAIQVSDGMRWFARKVNGGLAFEESLRRRLNRHRYQGLAS